MKEVSIRCEGARSISIDELFPFQDDIKTMKPSTLRKLEKVILEQGFSEPIAVWANSPDEKMWILNGHQRMTALQSLKSKGYFIPPIPVTMVQADDEQEARKKVLTLASQFGDFDGDNLAEFVAKAQLDTEWIKDNARLAAGDFKLPMLMTPVDEEPPPEPEAIPIVQRGEVYILGNHRLMCGDSTDILSVEKLMAGKKPDMVYTDPPYGMFLDTDYDSMFGADEKHRKTGHRFAEVKGDHDDFNPDFINTIFSAFPKCEEVFLWGADYYSDLIPDRKDGSWIVWDKRLNESMDKVTGNVFELCWSKAKHKRQIARIMWSGHHGMQKDDTKMRVHPTQKPVALIEWFFDQWGAKTKSVVDIFGGSGSTLIACEKTQRQCFMMELDPIYCGVIIDRWEKFADKQAIRESDGRLWLDIKAEALST